MGRLLKLHTLGSKQLNAGTVTYSKYTLNILQQTFCSQRKIIAENTPQKAHHGRQVLQPPSHHIKYSTWKAHYELVQHAIHLLSLRINCAEARKQGLIEK